MSILTHDEAKRLSQSSTDPLEVIRNVEAAVIVKLAVSQNALKDEIRLIWKPKCDALRQQLEAAQAEVKHLNLHLKATQSGRDAALARLSKIERQEPVAEMTLVDMGIGDARQLRVNWLMDGYLDVGAKLYASAGASPVEPSQAQPPAPGEAAREYMTGYSDGREWAGATSQAQPERAPLSADAYEVLVDDLGEWSRHVVEDTAHITLDTHIRRTLAVHGIKQGGQHD